MAHTSRTPPITAWPDESEGVEGKTGWLDSRLPRTDALWKNGAMDNSTLDLLRRVSGADHVTTAPEELACYAYDGSAREYPPAAVVFPGSAAEVAAIMRLAAEKRFPVVPRGAGTGMTGGALAIEGGVVLALARLNRIREIDTENQVAVVEPGVITGDLKKAAAAHGLFYPPDPASFPFCTIGGNVAECAGGPAAVKYGVTRDYVLALEVVLPDGRIIHTGVRTAKGVMGYDLTRLFVGSEGTLGIFTSITLRLLPLPAARKTILALSPGIAQATALVTKILARLTPSTLEYLDRTALSLVSDKLPSPPPPEAAALLLIEVDGSPETAAGEARLLRELLAGEGLLEVRTAENAGETEALWAARRAVSPAAFKLRPHKLGEDVVVPRNRIPALVDLTEKLAAETRLPIFTFGHAGDGNIHVNIMYDQGDAEESSRAREAKERLFDGVLALGGTLSGEHGTGITKSRFLPREVDQGTLAVMRDLKKLFDPLNILNPGKIFPA